MNVDRYASSSADAAREAESRSTCGPTRIGRCATAGSSASFEYPIGLPPSKPPGCRSRRCRRRTWRSCAACDRRACNRGRHRRAFAETSHPDVEWYPIDGSAARRRTTGIEACHAGLRRVAATTWDRAAARALRDVSTDGDSVVGLAAQGAGTGAAASRSTCGCYLRVTAGRQGRLRRASFEDPSEALEAAGLSE